MTINKFKQYIIEQEEAEKAQEADTLKADVKEFIKTSEDLSDEALHAFADEKEVEHSEIEEIVYGMLKDYIMAEEGEEETEGEGEEDLEEPVVDDVE